MNIKHDGCSLILGVVSLILMTINFLSSKSGAARATPAAPCPTALCIARWPVPYGEQWLCGSSFVLLPVSTWTSLSAEVKTLQQSSLVFPTKLRVYLPILQVMEKSGRWECISLIWFRKPLAVIRLLTPISWWHKGQTRRAHLTVASLAIYSINEIMKHV